MSETRTEPRDPQPPDITRRTLSTFGYVVCFVVPILIAAIGFTLLHFHYNKEQLVRGDRLHLLTSDWKSGDAAHSDTVTGKLTLGTDGCLRLDAQDGSKVDVAWPAGYEAAVITNNGSPQVSVYNIAREIVAQNSIVNITLHGEVADAAPYAGLPCAPAGSQVFVVETDLDDLATH